MRVGDPVTKKYNLMEDKNGDLITLNNLWKESHEDARRRGEEGLAESIDQILISNYLKIFRF